MVNEREEGIQIREWGREERDGGRGRRREGTSKEEGRREGKIVSRRD